MSDIDFAQLGRERTASVKQAFDTPPPLSVAPPEGCPAPQQEPAGLGAASSPAPGPVDSLDVALARAEAYAQRSLKRTTGKYVHVVVRPTPNDQFKIIWERPAPPAPPKKRWQFWI